MLRKSVLIAMLTLSCLLWGIHGHVFASSGELRMAVENLTGEILDPIAGPTDCKWYQTLIYDSLVGLKPGTPELSTERGLAYKWEHSEDYTTWTFYLRKDVTFHNGDHLTAEDVKFSLERAIGPESKSTNRSSLVKTIKAIEALDKYTVKITCQAPDSLLPMNLSEAIGNEAMIVPKAYLQEKGSQYFGAHPVGTGPYKLKEHVPGRYILFEAVDKHWAIGDPKYKYIRLSIVPEALARVGLIEKGTVDIVKLPLEKAKEFTEKGMTLVQDPAQATTTINITDIWNKEYPVSDIRIRKALNLAIDRVSIQKALFSGMGRLAPYQTATQASIGYEPAKPPYPYNPDEAAKLVKEAGYGPQKPCEITFYSYPLDGFPQVKQVVEVLASFWGEVGIKAKIENVPEFGPVRQKMMSQKTTGDLMPISFGGRVWAMPITRVVHHSQGPVKSIRDEELDKAIDSALNATDPAKRAELSNKVFGMIYDKYYQIPLLELPGIYAVNTKTLPQGANWPMGPVVFDINFDWLITQ